MQYSEALMPEKEKKKLERLFKRGYLTCSEFELAVGKPEALEAFFAQPTTKHMSIEEMEQEYPLLVSHLLGWWQSFKRVFASDKASEINVQKFDGENGGL